MIKYTYDFPMSPVACTMALFYKKNGKILVCLGKRGEGDESGNAGSWSLPGGYMNAGTETSRTTATREIKEEIGIDIDEDRWNLLGVDDEPGADIRYTQVINICFGVYVTDKEFEASKANDDLSEIKWITVEEGQRERLPFRHNMVLDWAVDGIINWKVREWRM